MYWYGGILYNPCTWLFLVMRVLKISSVFLLIIVLLLGVAYLNRCRLGETVLSSALKRVGMRSVVVRINDFGFQRLTLNSLSFCKLTPEGELVVELKDLIVGYNLGDLLAGRINGLIVERLVVSLPETGPPKGSGLSLSDISEEIIIPLLSPCEFTVNTMILKGKQLGPFDSRPLGLHGKITSRQVGFSIIDLSDSDGAITMSGQLEPAGRLALDFTQAGAEEEPAFHLELSWQANMVGGLFTLDLSKTRTILAPFLASKMLPEIQGLASCRFQVKRVEKKSLLIQLEGEVGQPSSRQLAVENIEILLGGKLREIAPGHLLFIADPGLEFKGRNIHYQDKVVELVTGHLTANLETNNKQITISATGEPIFTINGLQLDGASVEEVNLHPLLELTYRSGSYRLASWPPFRIDLTGLTIKGFAFKDRVSLDSTERFESEFTLGPEFTFSGNGGSWRLILPELLVKDTGLSMGPLFISNQRLSFSPGNNAWRVALSTDLLELQRNTNRLSLREIDMLIDGKGDEFSLSGHFVPQNVPGRMGYELNHNLSASSGMLRVNTIKPLVFSRQTPLSSLIGKLPCPLEINGGELGVQVNLQWLDNKPFAGEIDTTLIGISGIYDDITFRGLNLNNSLHFLPEISTITPLDLTVAELQCGVPITDIFLKARFLPRGQIPLVAIDEIRADLLNGQAFAHNLRYDHMAGLNKFDLKVHGLDLASVASTMNFRESMDLSGKINGTIPLELSAEGVRVRNGAFVNQKPGGVIRYLGGKQSGLGQSSLTAVVQKALEEFHYDSLRAAADLQPSGELQINIHMEGKSPRLETNRPVHINLNTQQNILSLLKSLRYSGEMTDELDDKIKQKYSE